ncbi:hypothetical protein B0H19DRAFT_1268995 [Mycena capillaripes]|nr:hypothetical protein B0H19DRAFT_1268995 [Mycena capillaripes]
MPSFSMTFALGLITSFLATATATNPLFSTPPRLVTWIHAPAEAAFVCARVALPSRLPTPLHPATIITRLDLRAVPSPPLRPPRRFTGPQRPFRAPRGLLRLHIRAAPVLVDGTRVRAARIAHSRCEPTSRTLKAPAPSPTIFRSAAAGFPALHLLLCSSPLFSTIPATALAPTRATLYGVHMLDTVPAHTLALPDAAVPRRPRRFHLPAHRDPFQQSGVMAFSHRPCRLYRLLAREARLGQAGLPGHARASTHLQRDTDHPRHAQYMGQPLLITLVSIILPCAATFRRLITLCSRPVPVLRPAPEVLREHQEKTT